MQQALGWPVAVFAHNEERNIIACLESLWTASSRSLECYVLANACTDRTEELVLQYSQRHRNVHLISISLGDKANAWNAFVHDIAPRVAPFYFFIDGDVRASTGAIDFLAAGLERNSYANGASALPRSGRAVEDFRGEMLRERGVAGNLYALRGCFVQRVRDLGVRMPIGIIGEDSLVGAMLKWDLRGDIRWDSKRVEVLPEAEFEFDSVSYVHPTQWKKYLRRKVRYSIRGFQNRMLGLAIQPSGFVSLPPRVEALYQRYGDAVEVKWRGLDTVFDWVAKRQISRVLGTHLSMPKQV